jgi:hypothetical protein
MPTIPKAQGEHWSNTRDFYYPWQGHLSRLGIGHKTQGVEDASYPWKLGAAG